VFEVWTFSVFTAASAMFLEIAAKLTKMYPDFPEIGKGVNATGQDIIDASRPF
jgi:hypothetical protein